MINRGTTGATFTVHDNHDAQAPWHYSIGAGDSFASEQWHDAGTIADGFDLTLRGPNGLHQRFAGSLGADAILADALVAPLHDEDAAELALVNRGTKPIVFLVRLDADYPTTGARERRIPVAPGRTVRDRWRLIESANWYDLEVRLEEDAAFLRRFAGKVENGRPGRTDPAIG